MREDVLTAEDRNASHRADSKDRDTIATFYCSSHSMKEMKTKKREGNQNDER